MAAKKYKRMTEHIYDRFRNDDEFRSIWKCK